MRGLFNVYIRALNCFHLFLFFPERFSLFSEESDDDFLGKKPDLFPELSVEDPLFWLDEGSPQQSSESLSTIPIALAQKPPVLEAPKPVITEPTAHVQHSVQLEQVVAWAVEEFEMPDLRSRYPEESKCAQCEIDRLRGCGGLRCHHREMGPMYTYMMQEKLRLVGIDVPLLSLPGAALAMIQSSASLFRLKHAIDMAKARGVPLTSEFWTGVRQEFKDNFENDCVNSSRLLDHSFVEFCNKYKLLKYSSPQLRGVDDEVNMALASKTLSQSRFDEFWSSFEQLQNLKMKILDSEDSEDRAKLLQAEFESLSNDAKDAFHLWYHPEGHDGDRSTSDGHDWRSGVTLMRQLEERLQQPQNEVKNKTLQYLHPEVWDYLGRMGKDHPVAGWCEFRPEPRSGEKQKQSKKQKQSNEKPPSRSWVDPTLFELLMKHHKCRVKCKTPEKLFLQSTTGENSKKTNVRYLGCECLCGQSAKDDTASDVTCELSFEIGPEVTVDVDVQLSFSHSAHSKRHIGRKKPNKCNCHMVKLTLAQNGESVEVAGFKFFKEAAADTSED